ncbi:hypothetical protein FJ364_00670 [Candidatus Dependentiae bacterium]|nr:hypothetical protein [Candidatus Dependentiae bacterium]
MKFFVPKILLLAYFLLGGCSSQNNSIQSDALAAAVLLPNGTVSPTAVKLMEELGCVQVPTRVDHFVEAYFPHFCRKRGVERWQMDNNFDEQKKSRCMALFAQLGFFNEVKPLQREYDYVTVLGGTLTSMRGRLGYAKKLWQQGIRFAKIVFLTSDRPLELFENDEQLADTQQQILSIKADWQVPTSFPKTEATLMNVLWDQADKPKDLSDVSVDIISVPMKNLGDGRTERPHTGDTLVSWLAKKPLPGRCLFISSQPFVGYQHGVIKRLMPHDFIIESVGPKTAPEKNNIAVLIDSLLRWLAFESFLCGLWDDKTLEFYLKQ